MLFDYASVTAESTRAAVDRALAAAEETVARVADPSTPRSWETTLRPLDEIADLLVRTGGRTSFLGYVHPDPDVRSAGKEAEERLSKWMVELAFREDLYRAVEGYSRSEEAAQLTGEAARLLRFTMRDFRKAGHQLGPEAREEVRRRANRLVELGVAFQRNVDEWDDAIEVSAEDLDGLPSEYLESLERGTREGTYRVTMAYPHVFPFLDHATRRDLRELLSLKFNTQAVEANRPILEETVRLRHEIADLFGVPSWAHHRLDERMAETPERVEAFYRDLIGPLGEAARRDVERMSKLLEADTGDPRLQVYDWRYYDTYLRKTEHGVDPSEVAAYLPLGRVLEGMLDLTGEVFGLRYRRVEAPVWHPDVVTYAIDDDDSGELIAHFYMDLFPREGKFSHAAAFPLVPGRRLPDGGYQRPVSAIVANLTKPTATRPSLLRHGEVETLFHEFGHILHQTLTRAELVRFSGTSTETDFVEAPPQIMQHWVWKPDVLARFARHHQTGEPIPADLVERLTAAKRLNIALAKSRQVTFGMLDLALHGPGAEKDLDRITRDATAHSHLPHHEGTFFPASFTHLLGGYDAGYYGYLWSEAYGDDMFSRFEEAGCTNPAVGRAYRREILERGGTGDGMELIRNFLGRDPDTRAFLSNLGI